MGVLEGFGPSVPFWKMQGSGNDFVAMDNRELRIEPSAMPLWAGNICARAFGVAADGVFFLDEAPAGSDLDYVWHFFNSDGSRAEMCGNASRCAARLAYTLGMAPAEHSFGTDAGPIRAKVLTEGGEAGQVQVRLTVPKDMELNKSITMDDESFSVHFVNSGVPHVVVLVNEVAVVDVHTIGLAIRYNDAFAPAGTNVNFVQVKDPETLLVRTYERGVEAETYACGTGVVASQLICNELGLTGPSARATTTGGESLAVLLKEDGVYLQGAATLVFSGDLYLDSLGLSL